MMLTTSEAGRRPAAPLVSAVICTRNRDDSVVGTVETLLANAYPNFELVVIDQSSDNRTAQALAPFAGDTRLRYIHTSTKGVGLARNIGLNEARAEFVLMTDDDCTVPADWMTQMVTALQQFPHAAVVFCDVLAAPHDPREGFVPATMARENRLITGLRSWCAAGASDVGLGAGMALRRSLVQSVGGIDAHLGSGAHFRSGWETDVALRVLLHEYQIYRTNQVSVLHYGFRTHEQGRNLIRRYTFGTAAAYGKLFRCGYWRLVPVFLFEIWKTLLKPTAKHLLRLRKPPVLGRAMSLIQGFSQGWRARIDRNREVFQIQTTG